MKLQLNSGDSANLVKSITNDDDTIQFQVGENRHDSSLLIASRWIQAWPVPSAAELNPADFQLLTETALEVGASIIILGTGHRQSFPHPSISRPVYEQGIGLEVMDSRAACRTYNALVADGRAVLGAFINA